MAKKPLGKATRHTESRKGKVMAKRQVNQNGSTSSKQGKSTYTDEELRAFEKKFDVANEKKAISSRADFLKHYPINRIKDITLEQYVIGRGTESFCAYVEPKTRAWANIQGSTSYKFGIYFGKTKTDSKKKYRFPPAKFGKNQNEVFGNVKQALLSLIKAGKSKNFSEIDKNPLSQMFRAKILSLYFPDDYLNICSKERIKEIALKIKIPERKFVSEYQHLLVKEKQKNEITKEWSNPKFMLFLIEKYFPETIKQPKEIYGDQFDFPPPGGESGKRERTTMAHDRDPKVRQDALRRAEGKCQFCGQLGFTGSDGRIFLETHHVIPLSEGGDDWVNNVIALCPNHHREAHYGKKAKSMRKQLLKKLKSAYRPSSQ